MKKQTYIIDYTITFNTFTTLHKTIKVKNCGSEMEARIKLGEYLKRKEPDMIKFGIDKCTKDILGFFNDIFDSNPFNFNNK